MFKLDKLTKKCDGSGKKKKNNRDNKSLKTDNVLVQDWTTDNTKTSKKNSSDKHCVTDDIYVLNYKREIVFFAQESDDCLELQSAINDTLQSVKSRSSCFQMLEVSIEGCSEDKLPKYINHWMTSLTNSFMTSSSQYEKEMSCDLLLKLIPRLPASQETNQSLTTLTNHIIGKSINAEAIKIDATLLLKLKILKEFLSNLPSVCGQHKGKYDKFFSLLIDHHHPDIQELAAQCLALVPCTGGVGTSGQAHQEAWSACFDKIMTDLQISLLSMETNITRESSNSITYYKLVHKITGLGKVLIALLMQPQIKNFESKIVFDFINHLLNIKMIFRLVKPYILQLHLLAYSVLEALLSRYCELISFNSCVIYDHMNQTLRNTSRKTSEEVSKFCSLRRSVYRCLKLCLLHNIFPFSLTSLTSIVKSAVKDCIFPIVIASASTTIANRMKISVSSHEAYSRKKNKNSNAVLDDQSQCATRSKDEEIGMCISALEALNTLVTSDSKLLQLSVLTEDKTVYPLVPSEESKRQSIMSSVVTPIWMFVIPQVRKLQGPWNANPKQVSPLSLGVYCSAEVKKAMYQLLSSLISLPLLRDTDAFNAACQLVRMGANSQSSPEVQQLCRQTLQWLTFTFDHARHSRVENVSAAKDTLEESSCLPSSIDNLFKEETNIMIMEEDEEVEHDNNEQEPVVVQVVEEKANKDDVNDSYQEEAILDVDYEIICGDDVNDDDVNCDSDEEDKDNEVSSTQSTATGGDRIDGFVENVDVPVKDEELKMDSNISKEKRKIDDDDANVTNYAKRCKLDDNDLRLIAESMNEAWL